MRERDFLQDHYHLHINKQLSTHFLDDYIGNPNRTIPADRPTASQNSLSNTEIKNCTRQDYRNVVIIYPTNDGIQYSSDFLYTNANMECYKIQGNKGKI